MSAQHRISRRDLFRSASALGTALAVGRPAVAGQPSARPAAATMAGVPFDRRDRVRLGIVGTGLRGRSVLHEWLDVEGVEIAALCDIAREKAERARDMIVKAGQRPPELYIRGERDFERLCAREDLDLVFTATPWEWHVPVCVAAMDHGHHVATEVPAACTVEDCWTLVDTSERTRRHCVMLENCCYGHTELLVLNMVRAGLFGEIKAGGAAYNHDLRAILFEDRDEGLWRRASHTDRNGNLYPTHGLGPVANYMDVNRGDRLETLVSMSTPEAGLSRWRDDHEPRNSPKWREQYVCGDLNRSLIRTARGRVILLEHDVVSPRPYSRINSVQGTRGIFEDYPPRVYLEGQPGREEYTTLEPHRATHEHALWRRLGERARTGGHGGMDYVMAWRLVQCLRDGLEPDMDVYDAAAWSAPGPLSDASVAKGGVPLDVPDFTRGTWRVKRVPIP